MSVTTILAGFFSGIIASMGMGGGAVLLIYLVVFAGGEQLASQGINLAFFIPIGILSLIIYAIKGKLKIKTVLPLAAFGLLGSGIGIFLSKNIDNKYIRIAFAVFIIILGIKEFFAKTCKQDNKML